MRLLEYISTLEGIGNAAVLMRDCLPFLKEYMEILKRENYVFKNRSLFRGIRGFRGFEKKTVRETRKPKDTPDHLHRDWDKAFKKKFGKPLRSASVFATGNLDIAKGYGTVGCIYPIGNYKIYASQKIEDLLETFESRATRFMDIGFFKKSSFMEDPEDTKLLRSIAANALKRELEYFKKGPIDFENDKEYEKAIDRKVEEWFSLRQLFIDRVVDSYREVSLYQAIIMKHEVMIDCKAYYIADEETNGAIIEALRKKL
jgi:hypothetical protein